MAILKNITEVGTDFDLLFKRDEYITDPVKTNRDLIGAQGCSHRNFPQLCRALKRYSGQHDSKMLRHFIVSISPCDEDRISNTELLKAARKISAFFRDCYVKYAIHTNTPHTHFHILVCNTRISDGKQISMSDGDLKEFKEHCSKILSEFGLEPVKKVDKFKTNDSLEINEDLFPKALTHEEQVEILYGDEPSRNTGKRYYGDRRYSPGYVNNTINVIIPPGTQGTLFQGRNGTPCISFKPSITYATAYNSNIPHNGAPDVGNIEAVCNTTQYYDSFSDWNDEEPEWINSDYSDDLDTVDEPVDTLEISNKTIASSESNTSLVDLFVIYSLPTDPFVFRKK